MCPRWACSSWDLIKLSNLSCDAAEQVSLLTLLSKLIIVGLKIQMLLAKPDRVKMPHGKSVWSRADEICLCFIFKLFPNVSLWLCPPCRLWAGVPVGSLWAGVLLVLPPSLHLLHRTQHRLMPGPQLPDSPWRHPSGQRANFFTEQQDSPFTSRPLQLRDGHPLDLLQQYHLHRTLHLSRFYSAWGPGPGGQPPPALVSGRHLSWTGSTECSSSLPLWAEFTS